MRPFLTLEDSGNLRYFTARVLSPAAGAVLTGPSLANLLRSDPDGLREDLATGIGRYLVLMFPDQTLDLIELADLCSLLGPLGSMPFLREIEGHPGLARVTRDKTERSLFAFGGGWHSDWSFQDEPPKYSMLYSAKVPKLGGDTVFSNQIMAWENLSKNFQEVIRGGCGVHSAKNSYSPTSKYGRGTDQTKMPVLISEDAYSSTTHPVMIRHSATGRESLYVNEAYTATLELDGWSVHEGQPLLDFLFRWSRLDEFILRMSWHACTLVVWDNHIVNHRAISDYDGFDRELIRGNMLNVPLNQQ